MVAKLVLVIMSILLGLLVVSPAMASPGGLDANGGHYCRKSKAYCASYGLKLNQYHCHRANCKVKR